MKRNLIAYDRIQIDDNASWTFCSRFLIDWTLIFLFSQVNSKLKRQENLF